MKNLEIINKEGKLLVESRQVAELVEKDHKNLLRDIAGYLEILGSGGQLNFEPSDFRQR